MREYKVIDKCSELEINELAKEGRELYQVYTYTIVKQYSDTHIKSVLRRKVKKNRLKNLFLKIKGWLK